MKVFFINCLGVIFLPTFVICGKLNTEIIDSSGYNNHQHSSSPSSSSSSDLRIIKVNNNDHDHDQFSSSSGSSSGSMSDEQIIRVIHEEAPSVLYQSSGSLIQDQQTQAVTPATSVIRIIKEHSSQSLPGPISLDNHNQHHHHPHHHHHQHQSIDTNNDNGDNNYNHHHHHQTEKIIKVIHEEASTILHPVPTGATIQHQESNQPSTILKLIKEHVPQQIHQQQQQQQQHQQSIIQNGQNLQHSERFIKIIHEEPGTLYETPISNQYLPPNNEQFIQPLTAFYQQGPSYNQLIHQQANLPVIPSIRPTYSFSPVNHIFQQQQQQGQHQSQFQSDIYHPNSKVFKLIHQIAPIPQAYPNPLHPIINPQREIKIFKFIRPSLISRPSYRHNFGPMQNPYYQHHPEQRVKVIKVVHEPVVVPQTFHHRSHGWA